MSKNHSTFVCRPVCVCVCVYAVELCSPEQVGVCVLEQCVCVSLGCLRVTQLCSGRQTALGFHFCHSPSLSLSLSLFLSVFLSLICVACSVGPGPALSVCM